MESQAGPFHVYVFQPKGADSSAIPGANPEDAVMSYNLGGIRMNQAAFRKLEQEISLSPVEPALARTMVTAFTQSEASDKAEFRLVRGIVPVDREIFRRIVIRESRIPTINPADFSVQSWTERTYYEVCTDPAIYAALEKDKLEKDKEKKKAARAAL
jgi:hypothetical protein